MAHRRRSQLRRTTIVGTRVRAKRASGGNVARQFFGKRRPLPGMKLRGHRPYSRARTIVRLN